MTIHQILTKYWGHNHFRELQEDIIKAVLNGKDTLALLPTGGGKSICFQVPAMAKEGICIVVSPLIALMKDQVENLKKKSIKAIAITSAMHKNEIDIAFDNCIYGNIKFLYISPERLTSELAQVRIKKMKVSFIAVDEAHCISQWGYNFRPSYLNISKIRELHPNSPVLALTATATPEVVKDIQQKLSFKKENIFQKSYERKNVAYVVLKEEDKYKRLIKILNKVKGSGIVYVRNRKKTKEISEYLKKNKVNTDYYHAGLDAAKRDKIQENWTTNKTRIIVSTNAFGMGIDKPDVRLVVHLDLPECIEEYFQEAGRAGRDEKKSYAILLFNDADRIKLETNIAKSFPSMDEIKKTYQALANYYQISVESGEGSSHNFDISEFCNVYQLNIISVYHSLKFLEKEDYISVTDALNQPSRVHFSVNKEELYKFQIVHPKYDDFIKLLLRSYSGMFDEYANIKETELAKRSGIEKKQVEEMLQYLDKTGIISYIKQSALPKITYTRARADAKNLLISKENYASQKEKALKQMEAIIHYASSTHKCRSQLLLAYFGETDTYRCGICDVCLERNKLELNDVEFKNISDQIKNSLKKESLSLNEIVAAIQNEREDKIIKVVQWLSDNNKLVDDGGGKLKWRK